jgi:hypothetical protein
MAIEINFMSVPMLIQVGLHYLWKSVLMYEQTATIKIPPHNSPGIWLFGFSFVSIPLQPDQICGLDAPSKLTIVGKMY